MGFVELLLPFAAQAASFSLSASVRAEGTRLHFRFELSDPRGEVLGAPAAAAPLSRPVRADDLWRATCFEAFWGEPGSESYWELNLAPSGREWNLYSFTSYRQPFPPFLSKDYSLTEFRVGPGLVEAELRAERALGSLEANLCAVILTQSGPRYLARNHAATKPDFHDRASFRLSVGSS